MWQFCNLTVCPFQVQHWSYQRDIITALLSNLTGSQPNIAQLLGALPMYEYANCEVGATREVGNGVVMMSCYFTPVATRTVW